jgi:Tfp pilus assembly protein PilF
VSARKTLSVILALCAFCSVLSGCSRPVRPPETKSVETTAAREQYEQGKFAEAESALKVIVDGAPDDKSALNTLALSQAAQGKNDLAIAQYAKLVRLDPKDHASWYRMALLERVSGKPDKAAAHLEKALATDPNNRSYTDELARTKMMLGNNVEAAELWGLLASDKKQPPGSRRDLFVLKAQAYQAAKDYRRAKKAYRAALKLDPENGRIKALMSSLN